MPFRVDRKNICLYGRAFEFFAKGGENTFAFKLTKRSRKRYTKSRFETGFIMKILLHF